MGKNFRETLREQLRDPAFKDAWDDLAPERQAARADAQRTGEESSASEQTADPEGADRV